MNGTRSSGHWKVNGGLSSRSGRPGPGTGCATMGPPPVGRHHRPSANGSGMDGTAGTGDGVVDVPSTDEWRALKDHFEAVRDRHLRQLFAEDPGRGSSMAVVCRRPLSSTTPSTGPPPTPCRALMAVARRAGVEARRDAMFAGRHINTTEDRAVLHVALRMPKGSRLEVDGRDVVADVHEVLDRMGSVASSIRSGRWTGATGRRITRRGQHRHRGFGPRPGHGLRGPARLRRLRPSTAASCPTSTRSTSTTRPTTSTRPRPSSW